MNFICLLFSSFLEYKFCKGQDLSANRGDPWTTQVCTAQVHLYLYFFFNKYMYCFDLQIVILIFRGPLCPFYTGHFHVRGFWYPGGGCPRTNRLWMLRDNLNNHQVNLIYGFSTAQGPVSNLCIAQGSTVYSKHWDRQHLTRGALNICWMKFIEKSNLY